MSKVVEFLKEFGSLFNTALIVALFGFAYKLFQAILRKKDAELDLLKERINTLDTFSVENVADRFQSLKDYYERHLRDWHEASIKALEEEKQKAIKQKETEFKKRIEEEIQRRNDLINSHRRNRDALVGPRPILTPQNVCGQYRVTGYNPYCPTLSYFGELTVEPLGECFSARWNIGATRQQHQGLGILVGNALAFVFEGDLSQLIQGTVERGIVIYECITPNALRGYWTSLPARDFPPPGKLGYEDIRRVDATSQQAASGDAQDESLFAH